MEDILVFNEEESLLVAVRDYIKWWEKKRLWFNLILLLGGVIPIVMGGNVQILFSYIIIPIGVYAFFCNLCYCAGWGLGIIVWNYTGHIKNIAKANWFLFIAGTLFSLLLTVAGAISLNDIHQTFN